MNRHLFRRIALICFFVGLLRTPLPAQTQAAGKKPRASQHGSITQQVNDTTITVEYNRPVARGRELFGALIPWGKIWNPGADNGTTIALSTDIRIDGQSLAAGTYSVWMQPQTQPKNWTVIFSRAQPVWHEPYPRGREALQLQVTPRTAPHMETLAFYFPIVDGRHAEMVMHWGTTAVPLELDVP
jgi:hypothetical protein